MTKKNKLLFRIAGIFIIFIISSLILTAFSRRISGKVIDASTEVPITGAVVLAQWTISHGIGDHSHTVSKITEVLTDQNGEFIIWGPLNTCADPPEVVIYKAGYVAWRNDYTFPGYVHHLSRDAQLSKYTFKMVRFKTEYSIAGHSIFMGLGIIGADFKRTPYYSKAEQEESSRSRPELDKGREEGIEGELVQALEKITFSKTKYEIHQLCPSLKWVPYGTEIERLRQQTKKANSRLYNTMKKYNIVMIIEGDETYFLKTHWD